MPNGDPTAKGNIENKPEDLGNVLKRAERTKEFKWGYQKVYTAEEATELLNALYEKYSDKVWADKLAAAKRAEDEQNEHYKRGQEFSY